MLPLSCTAHGSRDPRSSELRVPQSPVIICDVITVHPEMPQDTSTAAEGVCTTLRTVTCSRCQLLAGPEAQNTASNNGKEARVSRRTFPSVQNWHARALPTYAKSPTIVWSCPAWSPCWAAGIPHCPGKCLAISWGLRVHSLGMTALEEVTGSLLVHWVHCLLVSCRWHCTSLPTNRNA